MRSKQSSKNGSPKVPSTPNRVPSASPPSPTTAMSDSFSKMADALRPTLRTLPYASEKDFVDWAYTPHTVTVGVVLFSALWFITHTVWATDDELGNIKQGLLAAAWTVVVFGVVHLPDGIMIRPHPAIWRGVLALALLYLVVIVFFLFQDLPTVRTILGYYDPVLNIPLPERSYADDCRLSTPEDPHKFWNTVADEFLIAHLGGYFAKTLVLRDWRMVTAVSIGFELIEVTFQHLLDNFKECWWDHLIVDVIICNAGGTVLGLIALRLLNAKQFHWVRLEDIRGVKGKAKRIVGQLAPRAGLTKYQWDMFQSPKRFGLVMLVLSVMFLQEVNCFTMKYMLNMVPAYHLVIGRLAFMGILALPGMREFYDFVSTTTKTKRMGTTAWVGAAALFFETCWIVKMMMQGRFFRDPWPAHIALPWLYTIPVFVLWFVGYFGTGVPAQQRRGKRTAGFRLWCLLLNGMWYSMALVLLVMCAMGNRDVLWRQPEFDMWAHETLGWPLVPLK